MRGYFIRITPDDASNTTLLDIKELFDLHLESTQYVISMEIASRLHFHALLYSSYSPERLRYRIKSVLDCQLYISGKDIQDKVSCIAYTIKDGSYVHRGIDVWTWMQAKQKTHKKVSFEDAVKVISQNYAVSKDDDKLLDEIRQVYIDYNRRMYKHHIRGLYDTIKIANDRNYWERTKKEILGLW